MPDLILHNPVSALRRWHRAWALLDLNARRKHGCLMLFRRQRDAEAHATLLYGKHHFCVALRVTVERAQKP